MIPRTSFQRKIAYLAAIVWLLFCLYWLGSPAVKRSDPEKSSPGGMLAQIRSDPQVGLSQAQLGQIDPTSETLKLALLGMRGLAANFLWQKATDYKMKKDWTNLGAAVEQITKVQPNFVSVWVFQAWNQSYNISTEFDDVRQRYRWVIRGINFLQDGIEKNGREPRLPWEAGWIVSNKIGRADERLQFRRLFKLDDEFHDALPFHVPGDDPRDNWLVAREWFIDAEDLADTKGVKMKGKGPLIYRSNAPMCLMSYAEALEKDGRFKEEACVAWREAGRAWQVYGTKDMPTAGGFTVQLNDKEKLDKLADDLADQIYRLGEGLREKIYKERYDALSEEDRKALETPRNERRGADFILAERVERVLKVTEEEVARRITGPNRQKALQLAREAAGYREISKVITGKRHVVNFEYWGLRAKMEQRRDVVDARELIYQADRLFEDEGDLAAAIAKYDQAFQNWSKVLKLPRFRLLLDDPVFGDDMMEVIDQYAHILKLDDQEFPDPFVLQNVIDEHGRNR